MTVSGGNRVPAKIGVRSLWESARELYDLAASGDVAESCVELRLHALSVMLASDPLSVFDFVPLPTTRADGIRVSVVLKDSLSADLALATNDVECVRHKPSERDSAERL